MPAEIAELVDVDSGVDISGPNFCQSADAEPQSLASWPPVPLSDRHALYLIQTQAGIVGDCAASTLSGSEACLAAACSDDGSASDARSVASAEALDRPVPLIADRSTSDLPQVCCSTMACTLGER